MKKIFGLLFVLAICCPVVAVQASNVVIPGGTPIAVELTDPISSSTTFVGETVEVIALDDTVINDIVVIEKGAKGFISVSGVRKAKEWGKSGGVELAPQYIKTVNWVRVPLEGTIKSAGDGHPGIKFLPAAIAGKKWRGNHFGAAAVGLLFPDTSPGEDSVIPAGTKLIVTVNGDVDLGKTPEELSVAAAHIRRVSADRVEGPNWTGTWFSSEHGKIKLTQSRGSNVVIGTCDYNNARIKGTITGNTLTGTWKEQSSNDGLPDQGKFEFVLAPDNKTVTMLWCSDSSGEWVRDRYPHRIYGGI